MASSSGTSYGSSNLLPNCGSEEDLQGVMEQRKEKRKLSNRESARRSRVRKQKHLDDLMAQVGQLTKENSQIIMNLNITTQNCLLLEGENSVLRARTVELSSRLQSLHEILHYMNGNHSGLLCDGPLITDNFINPPWNFVFPMNQPIMASADLFPYC